MNSKIIDPTRLQPGPVALGILGLELRDYLAAAALSASVSVVLKESSLVEQNELISGMATFSYEIADAMLAARGKHG